MLAAVTVVFIELGSIPSRFPIEISKEDTLNSETEPASVSWNETIDLYVLPGNKGG